MGVPALITEVKETGREIPLRFLSGYSVAIDVLTYIIRFYKTNSQLTDFIKTYVTPFINSNVRCVYVFDGTDKPKEKLKTITRRKINGQRIRRVFAEFSEDLTKVGEENIYKLKYKCNTPGECYDQIYRNLQELNYHVKFPSGGDFEYVKDALRNLNLEVVEGPGEAEKICCDLQKNNSVDFVLSEDTDIVLYGPTKFLMNLNVKKKTVKIYEINEFIYHIERKYDTKLNLDQLQNVCILTGTDYNRPCFGSLKEAIRNIATFELTNIKKIFS